MAAKYEVPHSDPCQATFLLSYTGEVRDTSAEAYVTDAAARLEEDLVSSPSSGCFSGLGSSEPHYSPGSPSSQSPDWVPVLDVEISTMYSNVQLSEDVSQDHHMGSRMDELINKLFEAHEKMGTQSGFDFALARSVFTAQNAQIFLGAHFDVCHYDIPIVHRSTFSARETSTPLLLAILMNGSLYAPPNDSALAVRSFFRDAEEFIFRHLLGHYEAPSLNPDCVQAIQAALLTTFVQYNMRDLETRRRIRTQRFPILVSLLRSLGLTTLKRRNWAGLDWRDCIADEVRIRQVPL